MTTTDFRVAVVLAATTLIGGCASYQLPDIDPRERAYPASVTLDEDDILRNTPYSDISRARFIVVHTSHNNRGEEYRQYIMSALAALGLHNVITPQEYADLVVEHNVEGGSGLDIASLQRAYRTLGPFLVMTFSMSNRGDYATSRMNVYDPEGNEALLSFQRSDIVFLSVDHEHNNPMINLLREWVIASGGLGHARESDIVSGPVQRITNGWFVDETGRSRHLASGIQVTARIGGMPGGSHYSYDADGLNTSLEFRSDDMPVWLTFYVYPRFHGAPDPSAELEHSLSEVAQLHGETTARTSTGRVNIDGKPRETYGATFNFEQDGNSFTSWTLVVPTRAWYLKVRATEMNRSRAEPGAEAVRLASRLLSTLGMPVDAFEPDPLVEGFEQDGIMLSPGERIEHPVTIDGETRVVTLAMSYNELEDGQSETVVSVENPFDQRLKYQLFVHPDGYVDRYPLTSCPIPPGSTRQETWPYLLPRFEILAIQLLSAEDERGCEH